MKKTGVLCAAIVSAALLAIGISAQNESTYTRKATVDSVHGESVFCSDTSGNQWEFCAESGYVIGQEIVLKMHDNHTSGNIFDDVILSVK